MTQELVEGYQARYARAQGEAERAVRLATFGSAEAGGWTTIRQVEQLTSRLGLSPGKRLLDVGSGRGWPGLELSRLTGCDTVLSDVPVAGLASACARADADPVLRRVSFVRASGTALPFRAGAFDAIVHTDVL